MAAYCKRDSSTKQRYFTLLIILCVQPIQASINIEVVPQELNWWEARDNCKREHTGDLFIPKPGLNPKSNDLYQETYYWIGALTLSEWRWQDNSSPFQRIGYLAKEHVVENKSKSLDGNSLAQCYRNCRSYIYIGLSDTKCYCLDDKTLQFKLSSPGTEHHCPGNFAETCGNEHGLSVYKTNICFQADEFNHCVSGYWKTINSALHLFFIASNCTNNLYSVCEKTQADKKNRRFESGLCFSIKKSPWHVARSKCNLVIRNNVTKDKLRFIKEDRTFWIGLNRRFTKKWINGTRVSVRDGKKTGDRGSQMCLAFNPRRKLKYKWITCKGTYPSLCAVNNLPTEKVQMTTLHERSNYLPSTVKTATKQQEDAGELPSEANVDLNKPYGLYIGMTFGIILLAGLLTFVIVVWKRKEKMCFQKQHRVALRFQTGTGNLIHDSGPEETEIVPSYMFVEQATDAAAQASPPNPESKEISNNSSAQGFDEDDTYDRAGNFKKVGSEVVENCYGHLKASMENVYDIAGRRNENDEFDITYNHLGSIPAAQASAVVDNLYSHLKVDVDNVYDIAGQVPGTDQLDSTYSHLETIRDDQKESGEQDDDRDTDN